MKQKTIITMVDANGWDQSAEKHDAAVSAFLEKLPSGYFVEWQSYTISESASWGPRLATVILHK